MERPKVGVGIIVVQDGKVLVGKRKNAHGSGCWAFAGGHLEFGETIEECVKRELMEETGLIPLLIEEGPWTNDVIEQKHYVTLFVYVRQFEGIPELLEPEKCEEWKWFDADALPEPLFQPIVSLKKKTSLLAAILS